MPTSAPSSSPSSGLSPALQNFFSGVQDVAANPSSVPARQSMISEAESMLSRFQTLDARFNQLRDGVNTELEAAVGRINSLAQQISALNEQISGAEGPASQPPNDLLDQRGLLISELNKYVKVTTIEQADRTVNVSIGSGQSLVVGSTVLPLAVSSSDDDPSNLEISLTAGSSLVPLPSDMFQGGSVGGLFAFREQMLDGAQNQFGRVALVLAHAFNEQHRLGQDLGGRLGGDFFAEPQPTVQGRTTNLGDAALGAVVADAGAVTASNYSVMYSGGNYTVTRIPENTQTTYASLPQTFDGITLSLDSGTPQDGDTFLVLPTRNAVRDLDVVVSDTSYVAAAAPVRTGGSLANTGNARISAGVVSDVSNLPLATPVTLTYASATNEWSVSGATPAAGPFTYSAGGDIAINGVTVSITGTPKDGDTFTISNNSAGVADSRNASLLAALQTVKAVAGGTASFQSAYSQIVSDVGNSTREIQVQLRAQEALRSSAVTAEQGYSGVNLDEEAANLVRFQQAYQASGKVLEIASKMFDEILALGR